MNALLAFAAPMTEADIERLGWVLMHSLWEFTIVALFAAIMVRTLPRHSAAVRYGVLLFAMAAMAATPAATWVLLPSATLEDFASRQATRSERNKEGSSARPRTETSDLGNSSRVGGELQNSNAAAHRDASNAPGVDTAIELPNPLTSGHSVPFWPQQMTAFLQPYLAWIVAGWGLGVVLCSARPLLGWRTLRRLRRVGVSHVPDEVLAAMRRATARLGLRRSVRVLQSTLVHVPVVIGYLRPLILLPASLLTCIPTAQLEAILAHELAHVRRHDFVVNLVQTLIETLFFYHPAVWWLSREIRVEREHCCDDLVVRLFDNRLDYGRALVAIEQLRGQSTVFALGAADGSLLARVRRIVGLRSDRTVRWSERWPAALLGLACLGAVVALSMTWGVAAQDESSPAPKPAIAKLPGDITVELKAVGFHPSKDRDWWRPDGGTLTERPQIQSQFSVMPNSPEQAECREFLTHIRGLPRDHSVTTDYGVTTATGSSYADGLWIGEHGAGPFKSKTTTIRLGLTTEPFGPLVTIDRNGLKQANAEVSKDLKPFYDRIVPLRVESADGNTELVLENGPLNELYKLAPLELHAVDLDGKVHRSSSMSSHVNGGAHMGFRLPRDRVASFAYRLRPYRHWVKFENVSLEPGHKTEVKVSIESATTSASAPPEGLEFLALYPKLHGLSLGMTEKQFLSIVEQQKLKMRKEASNGGTHYRIATEDGHTVIVMFGKNSDTCSGIQRIRGEDPPPQAAPALRIIGRVLDSESGQPIANCRVVPTSFDWERERVTWQSQYLKEFTDGRYAYETDRPWPKTKLRIEADGYLPATTRVIDKSEKSVELDVKLVRGVFAGIVLTPDGKPAARAQLAVATHTNEVVVRSGQISYGGHGHRLRKVVEADEQGRFKLPAEIDVSILVVTHESGFAKVATVESNRDKNARPLQQSGEAKGQDNQSLKVTVQPWGRVEGTILARNQPVVGAKLSVHQDHGDIAIVRAQQDVESDAKGRFVIERIPAGATSCQRYIDNGDGKGSKPVPGLVVRFGTQHGKTTTVQIGSPGRTVAGKLAVPDGFPHKVDWAKVHLDVTLESPNYFNLSRFGMGELAKELQSAQTNFLQTDEGKLYGRAKVAIAADGSFRIEGMPEADYELHVRTDGLAVIGNPKREGLVLHGSHKFPVPAVALPAADSPVDLGTIKLTATAAPKDAPREGSEARAEPVSQDILTRKVSLTAKAMPLKDAFAAIARAASAEMQLDANALKEAGLDLDGPVTATIRNEVVTSALLTLIGWDHYLRIHIGVRGHKLIITSRMAQEAEIARHLPDWLKPHYSHGLVAKFDDEYNIVSIFAGDLLTDDLLTHFKSLPELRELHIERTKLITSKGLEHLAELPSLQKLSLYEMSHDGKRLGDAALERIAGMKSLRALSISGCDTTDAGVRFLEKMPWLTRLEISGEGLLTDACIGSIAKLSRLEHLSINSYVNTANGWMRFSKEATQALAGLRELEELHLVGQNLLPETLQFTKLTALSLGGESIDDACAEKIASFRGLQSLDLVYTNITDAGLTKIAGLPTLSRLNIDSHVITDGGVAHLKRLTKLEHLSLRASRLTDDTLSHLADIKALERIDLHGSGWPGSVSGKIFTIAGVQRLKVLPNLRHLSLTNLQSDDGFLGLKELPRLRSISMHMTNVKDAEIDALEDAMPETWISAFSGRKRPLKSKR